MFRVTFRYCILAAFVHQRWKAWINKQKSDFSHVQVHQLIKLRKISLLLCLIIKKNYRKLAKNNQNSLNCVRLLIIEYIGQDWFFREFKGMQYRISFRSSWISWQKIKYFFLLRYLLTCPLILTHFLRSHVFCVMLF